MGGGLDFLDCFGLERPVVQAALGGGISRAELAGAVCRAGGLGTVCTLPDPAQFRREIRACREQVAGKPFSVNLLFPVLRRGHVEACVAERVPVVSLFFGHDADLVRTLHEAGAVVLHQVGTEEQARRALHDGADGLVAQGLGAGGHVLATESLDTLVPRLVELSRGKPVLASGGIHDRASAARARSLGAAAVWVGTRFLLTHESHAHPAYKARLLAAERTFETMLFGLGWSALHRVAPNGATQRWCAHDPLGPRWVRAVQRGVEPFTRLLPPRIAGDMVARQRVGRPMFSPAPLVRGMDEALVEVTPLYAGECVAKLRELKSASDVVLELSV